MRSEVIANRYAEALLAIATEQNQAEIILEAVQWYQKMVAASLLPLLQNPKIPYETKEGLIKKIFPPTGTLKCLFHFIRLLLKKGRIDYLNDILRLYPKRHEERIGIMKARLYLAYPMEEALVDRLRSKLQTRLQRAVKFDVIQNPSILGGFIFATDTLQIDASLKRKLSDIEAHLRVAPLG